MDATRWFGQVGPVFDDRASFVSRAFLRGEFDLEYKVYLSSGIDEAVRARLNAWNERPARTETQLESAFIQTFFVETWGHAQLGGAGEHTLLPKLQVPGEGEADLALGWFRGAATPSDAQVLCEFKDIRSKLDAKQNRKGKNQTPVEQCLGYLRGARRGLFGNEPVQPWWGLVTDMNEFRLYWWDRAPAEYLRFVIRGPRDLFAPHDLLSEGEEASFDRFLFWKLLQRDYLLSQAGRPPLLRLVERQWVKEEKLEGEFYEHYKAIRERLFNVLRINNPTFPGSPSDLLRLTQKLLDRFIFAFYCEDMGERMLFPPQMLRDHMKSRSTEQFYDASAGEFWGFFRRLFQHMDTGGLFGQLRVPHINGGLFAPDPQIDALNLPNHVFAAAGQGRNEASLEGDKTTLLFLSARYNFAARGEARQSISLYTLGRIFEQSITELEYRVGELEGRDTVAKLSKRKRDGVYYTPEWVVNYLVEQTLGPWFAAVRTEAGYPADGAPSPEAAEAYIVRLKAMRIVDPACGSGAFLIAAFRRLLQERIAAERDRQGMAVVEIAEAPLIAEILANNLYGVDINPAAVEIAKLALWLHSARADAPLSMLDRTLRCGNSLVAHDIWLGREADQQTRERVLSFDWREAFPEVWPQGGEGGFDIVLGNPPYVKLQNMKRVYPETVAYLQANRGEDSYRSAQTGNFDLYLAFIEKGLRLLGPGGRMAYIAPSLWAVNEYGAGLRALLARTRQLERWVDFKSFQVFDEAITYTALQFFTREPQAAVKIAVVPDGRAANVDWERADLATPYEALPAEREWLMATGPERALIERLRRDCLRLDDPSLTEAIFQGLVTSADKIYHMKRLGDDRYRCSPADRDAYEVRIEDRLMKPLISGAEAKRFEEPETDTYLLFPYEPDERNEVRLIAAEAFAAKYPNAWQYLKSWERELRGRESGKMDRDDDWWGYVYPKNLGKHAKAKLIVPRLVEHIKCSIDEKGGQHLDNVDVGGVVSARQVDPALLAGVLNGPVADFVFRQIAKPFRGDFRSANKQFIAPLPIPNASPEDRADIAARARSLQQRWTQRRDLARGVEERLAVLGRAKQAARWLWPHLHSLEDQIAQAPRSLTNRSERLAWAKAQLDELEAQACEKLQAALDRGERLEPSFAAGELKLFVGGAEALSRIYLEEAHGRLVEAYWRWLAIAQTPRDAARFAADLRRPPADPTVPGARQFVERVAALAAEIAAIEAEEEAMNERLFALYRLTMPERLLVGNDASARR